MKLQAIVSASLFALITAFAVNAGAATDAPGEAPAVKAAAQKKVKPHSHAEEKNGVAPKAAEATADKAEPSKSKHSHQRDAK